MNQLLAMRAFVRVVDTGSFSRAADSLDLPRSTVSKLVLDLEAHLGIRLLQRTTRSVAPTADGREYHAHARRLIDDVDIVEQALRGRQHRPRGHLRVDAPASFATSLLVPALAQFHRDYPEITIALGIGDRPVDLVGDGVDCVVRAGLLGDSAMVGRKLFELPYATSASRAYLDRHGRPGHPSELEAHLRIGYFFAATARPDPLVFDNGRERHLVEAGAFSTNDGNGVLAMLRAGLGIGQHFSRVLAPHLASGELETVLDEWARPALPFHVLYPSARHRNARLQVFVDWLVEHFRQ